jgi:Tol biopolymer transport system component
VEPTATDGPSTGVPAEAVCAIAYAYGDSLFCLDATGASLRGDGLPRPIAIADHILHPRLSPDGRWVAYLTTVNDTPQLRLAPIDGTQAILTVNSAQIDAGAPAFFEWQPGTHRLWFTTQPRNAVWVFDTDTQQATALLSDSQVLAITFAPDGLTAALVTNDAVQFINTDGTHLRLGLTIGAWPAPPTVQWHPDSQAADLAVPGETLVTLYRLTLAGDVQTLLTLPAPLTSLHFSPDGQWAAYVTATQLHWRSLVDRRDQVMAEGAALQGWDWSPTGPPFAYSQLASTGGPSGIFLAHAEGAPVSYAYALRALRAVRWVDAQTLVFLGEIQDRGWGLYLRNLNRETQLLASGLTQEVEVDVR